MKKLISSIAVVTVAFGVMAQDVPEADMPDFEQLKTEIQEQIQGELDNLPDAVQSQLREAKAALENARQQIAAMNMREKSPDEVKAIQDEMDRNRDQAQQRLEQAIANMDNVSEQVRAQVEQAKAEVQKRLEEKTAELRQLQEQIRQRIEQAKSNAEKAGSQTEDL